MAKSGCHISLVCGTFFALNGFLKCRRFGVKKKKCIKGAVRSPQKEAAFWHARDNETALCRVGALHLCLLLKCHSDTHTAEGKKQPQKVSHRAMMKALLERSLIRSVPIFRTDQATLKSILFSLFCARWSILSTGSSLKSHKVSKQCHYESSLLLVKPSFKKKHKKEKYNLNLPFLTLNKKNKLSDSWIVHTGQFCSCCCYETEWLRSYSV